MWKKESVKLADMIYRGNEKKESDNSSLMLGGLYFHLVQHLEEGENEFSFRDFSFEA